MNRPLGTDFNDIWRESRTFSLRKMPSAKWGPFCLGLNVSTAKFIGVEWAGIAVVIQAFWTAHSIGKHQDLTTESRLLRCERHRWCQITYCIQYLCIHHCRLSHGLWTKWLTPIHIKYKPISLTLIQLQQIQQRWIIVQCLNNGTCRLAAIYGAIILVPCHVVIPVRLIRRSGTRKPFLVKYWDHNPQTHFVKGAALSQVMAWCRISAYKDALIARIVPRCPENISNSNSNSKMVYCPKYNQSTHKQYIKKQ